MSGEPMALKFVSKINRKLKFFYWKNKFVTPGLRRILCNALIQPYFDYACTVWYLNFTVKKKKKKKKKKDPNYAKEVYMVLS